MAIPDFQSFMLPMLRVVDVSGPVHMKDLKERLAVELGLSQQDLSEMLPSGTSSKFDNRIGWTRTYLKKAGLIEYASRGVYSITKAGKDILGTGPKKIDISLLDQFPGFLEFRTGKARGATTIGAPESASVSVTPEESLESAYETLRGSLANDVLSSLKSVSPAYFEQIVVDLIVRMGYGGTRADAGQAIGRSGDGGIDGIIKEDRLGLDAVYVQAKRWDNPVGRPEIQKFAGALQGHRAKKGVFITTSSFSSEARDYVSRIESRIVLIDGVQMADLMIDHGVGVNTIATYEVKRLDSDYFDEK